MKDPTEDHSSFHDGGLLGDFIFAPSYFVDLTSSLKQFQTEDFFSLSEQQRIEKVNALLYACIEREKSPCFLLPAVVNFCDEVQRLHILESYTFHQFELWLNQFSGLSKEENFTVRSKIAGKSIPRHAYHVMFPIGMGKVYPGSHIVTAHSSPDLDTTVASFWGWLDAFAARVSEGIHLWNVPGGPPASQIEISFLFYQIFGQEVFNCLSRSRTALALSALDLMTQKGLVKAKTEGSILDVDHERMQNAVVLVDDKGYYLGDWRNFDVEGIRNVTMLFNHCLRWFENRLQATLISLFAKKSLSLQDFISCVHEIFSIPITRCQPAKEFTVKQRLLLQNFLVKVLDVEKGLESTYEDLAKVMRKKSLQGLQNFMVLVESLSSSPLFDRSGMLIEDRPQIFLYLERMIHELEQAIYSICRYIEKLEVALHIKREVFQHLPQHISYRDDVDEIRSKIGNYPYLTVTASDKNGKFVPLGIIYSQEIHQNTLGTVSLRDFCNREETKVPHYLEVISVIDHHKSSLQTVSPPLALIADSQSSNVLCAELAFKVNDPFSLGGMTFSEIERQLDESIKNLKTPSQGRLVQRLLQRLNAAQTKGERFISPQRELTEYMHFLFGILDDTDLLTKVSSRDLECVVHLLNRMKSLVLKKEVEVVSLDDIPKDSLFVQQAAQRILQNADMYSLYSKIYLAKEEAVETMISSCAAKEPSSFFADTKEQNGCARVGQTKMFVRNHDTFAKKVSAIRSAWYQDSVQFYRGRSEVDLHLHMISTVAGAKELYTGKREESVHLDELWIWIPFTEQSIDHLKLFLNGFRSLPKLEKELVSIEFYGEKGKDYELLLNESFLNVQKKETFDRSEVPITVLKYRAGTINSRKAMISPYLPKL